MNEDTSGCQQTVLETKPAWQDDDDEILRYYKPLCASLWRIILLISECTQCFTNNFEFERIFFYCYCFYKTE